MKQARVTELEGAERVELSKAIQTEAEKIEAAHRAASERQVIEADLRGSR